MIPLDIAWGELRQAGQFLSLKALTDLPAPPRARPDLVEHLRAALTSLPEDRREGPPFSALLDLVLETTLGLAAGWRKGSDVGASDALQLVDGTTLKPRRLWTSPARAVGGGASPDLAVFVVDVDRIGVGRGRRPVAQATEYLRRRGVPLALLTTGRTWRLVWADTDNTAWVEWDADRWLHADQLTGSFTTFRTVLGAAAITRDRDDDTSKLLLAIRDTRRGQAKLSSELGENVRRAVELLLHARKPALAPVWEQHQGEHIYMAACHLVMRLVVVLFAEARELLPVDNPIYYDAYSLRGLQEQLDRLGGRRAGRTAAWLRLRALARLIYRGSPHHDLRVPAYGSELFEAGSADSADPVSRAVALLEDTRVEPPDDEVVWRMLKLLTRTEQVVREGNTSRRVPVPVDFTELTSEYIGILYEGLLDYELRRADGEPIVFLAIGDQPALPLGRLEVMGEKACKALVEKAKVKGAAPGAEAEEEGDEDADEASDPDEAGGEVEAAPPPEDPIADDARLEARARAHRWAQEAVVVAGLVKKPKGKKGMDDPTWVTDRDNKAASLIAQVVPAGELYLVRWGGTRKGSGTFYTRPALTMPTVRRTLEPLLHAEDGSLRPPEELLKLKVCDPAMGSGSFLVAALRVLTRAVRESLHAHRRLHAEGDYVSVDCSMLPEADRRLREDRLDAVIRLAVVEHCLYGVDKNPLAVELGRVALWIETLDRSLPLTFLDHKLKKGDALVGCWLDRFAETPILAWWREAGDEKHAGIHHAAGARAEALAARRDQAVEALRVKAALLHGQPDMYRAPADAETLVAGLREALSEMHALPARDARKRALVYKTRVVGSNAYQRLRGAMNRWCALWFWPGDRVAEAPLDVAEADPAVDSVVAQLAAEHRFFHWELEFPDVFYRGNRGFHAMVGNPPWEIQKPNSKEFFSNHDPLYRTWGKQEALRKQRELFAERPAVERAWLDKLAHFKALGNFVRHAAFPFGDGRLRDSKEGRVSLTRKQADDQAWHEALAAHRDEQKGYADPEHPFRHQGGADLNTYKLFTEAAYALLRPGGQLGLVVPSGLYTDKGTGDLRRLLLERCSWRWLYGFENRDKIFNIHRSFKFSVVISAKGGRTAAFQAAFMRHDLEDWDKATSALRYPAERVTRFSPNSLSVLELRSERDLEVLSKIYDHSVLLGDQGPDGWGIRYATEFHMTNDSKLFIARDKAEELGYRADVYGRWVGPEGDVLLPLYEGRMIGQLDFSEKGWVSGKGRSAVWREIPWEDKRIEPQFLMRREDFAQSRPESHRRSRAAFMDVTAATNSRTCIAVALPALPCGNSAPVFLADGPPEVLSAVLSGLAFDYAVRQRCGGLHLNYFVMSETPLPISPTAASLLSDTGLRLQATAAPTACLAFQRRPRGKPASTLYERLRLRCMLDAMVAVLYGLDRSDFAWILRDCDHPVAHLSEQAFCRQLDPKGFWRVDKTEDPELRHTVLSLAAFDDLQTAIAAAGDRDRGIQTFCDQNDGDGWMLPEALRLADLEMTRTVDAGVYDARARAPQPVRARLGPRFLDWQLAQSVEESWAECERHAQILTGHAPATPPGPPTPTAPPPTSSLGGSQPSLFDALPARRHDPAPKAPMHIRSIQLSNFKNWGEVTLGGEAGRVELAPLTLVLGMNSSGKTSILLPLRMLKQTTEAADPSLHLLMNGLATDGVDLGTWTDIAHQHDPSRVVGVRLEMDGGLVVETSFRADSAEQPVVDRLVWDRKGDLVALVRKPSSSDYQLESPRFRLPNWDGARDVQVPRREGYEPQRAIELPHRALHDLGPTLGPRVAADVDAVKSMLNSFHYLGPDRAPPQRQFTWSQQQRSRLGSSGANAVDVLIGSQSRRETRTLLEQVSRWLTRLGLADGIELQRLGGSLLYQVVVVRGGERSNLVDVGFGVSQVLPVIVLLHFAPEGSILLIEDPEAHLHPIAQAELADMFAEVGRARNLQILVETHSEHLFRRLQSLVADGERLSEKDCALYFVRRDQPNASVERLEMDGFGRVKNWPAHFFGDAIGETERRTRKTIERLRADRGTDA